MGKVCEMYDVGNSDPRDLMQPYSHRAVELGNAASALVYKGQLCAPSSSNKRNYLVVMCFTRVSFHFAGSRQL
jgi:hypothetical protein